MSNWEDADAGRQVARIAKLNENLRHLGAEPLISVESAEAMAAIGDLAELRRAVIATATHLGRLIGLIGSE